MSLSLFTFLVSSVSRFFFFCSVKFPPLIQLLPLHVLVVQWQTHFLRDVIGPSFFWEKLSPMCRTSSVVTTRIIGNQSICVPCHFFHSHCIVQSVFNSEWSVKANKFVYWQLTLTEEREHLTGLSSSYSQGETKTGPLQTKTLHCCASERWTHQWYPHAHSIWSYGA